VIVSPPLLLLDERLDFLRHPVGPAELRRDQGLLAFLTKPPPGHLALVRGAVRRRARVVNVGEMAGGTISLRASTLRAGCSRTWRAASSGSTWSQ
jgi:hypothetical protein